MNYSMQVDMTKTNSTYINLRATPSLSGVDIGNLDAGQIAEGDEMVLDASGQPWLNVLMIDGMQTSAQMYAAAWLCKVTESPVIPPITANRIDFTISSDTPIRVTVNGILIDEYTGTISLSAQG
jgi:hypothetical protein